MLFFKMAEDIGAESGILFSYGKSIFDLFRVIS